MKKIVSLLFGASFLVTNIASAVQPKWEQWDVANSVAKEGSWLYGNLMKGFATSNRDTMAMETNSKSSSKG